MSSTCRSQGQCLQLYYRCLRQMSLTVSFVQQALALASNHLWTLRDTEISPTPGCGAAMVLHTGAVFKSTISSSIYDLIATCLLFI